MTRFLAVSLIVFLAPHVAIARVPDVVIEQCMDANDAGNLPDCLKEGAPGHKMLEIATSEEYYGDAAKPAAEMCVASNESYEGAWNFFRVAAKASVETRSLAGIEKISDNCIAAISDREVYQRLSNEAKRERQIQFPDELFSGGNLYHPFRGC